MFFLVANFIVCYIKIFSARHHLHSCDIKFNLRKFNLRNVCIQKSSELFSFVRKVNIFLILKIDFVGKYAENHSVAKQIDFEKKLHEVVIYLNIIQQIKLKFLFLFYFSDSLFWAHVLLMLSWS